MSKGKWYQIESSKSKPVTGKVPLPLPEVWAFFTLLMSYVFLPAVSYLHSPPPVQFQFWTCDPDTIPTAILADVMGPPQKRKGGAEAPGGAYWGACAPYCLGREVRVKLEHQIFNNTRWLTNQIWYQMSMAGIMYVNIFYFLYVVQIVAVEVACQCRAVSR